jgi:hypothetical protein
MPQWNMEKMLRHNTKLTGREQPPVTQPQQQTKPVGRPESPDSTARPSLCAAPGSGFRCEWIEISTPRLCGRPATHREPMTGATYCPDHAQQVADIFGYDAIDPITPNSEVSSGAKTP